MFGIGAARGTCGGCGQQVTWHKDKRAGLEVCPRCATPRGASAPLPVGAGGPALLVHTYTRVGTGGKPTQAFAAEATALGRVGWRVASQSQSGVTKWRLGAGTQPEAITVTYARDA